MIALLLTVVLAAEPTEAQQALSLLRQGESGVLGTSVKDQPYVSAMPFALNKEGQPIILISDLAVHTERLGKNPNASVIVNKPDKDGSYFAGSRVTMSGKFVKVTDAKQIEECRKVYLGKFKEAEIWADFGDFNYYKLEYKEIYLIGGFGEIHQIDLDDYKEAVRD